MLRDEREPNDHRPPRSSPLGRSEASEDFGVSLASEGMPGWELRLLWGAAAFIVVGFVALAILLAAPARPVDSAVLGSVLLYAAFALAFLVFLVILAVEAFVSWRRKRAEGRRYLQRLWLSRKESGPPRGP
jgi:hypothetical protein